MYRPRSPAALEAHWGQDGVGLNYEGTAWDVEADVQRVAGTGGSARCPPVQYRTSADALAAYASGGQAAEPWAEEG